MGLAESLGQKLFSREATGLVREISAHQAFMYNMMAVGLVGFTEAVLFSYAPVVLPGADIGLGIVTTVLAAIPFYIVVAMLVSSMPRAGGDYVWQSRILTPSLGFAATFSAWTVWQWFFGAFLGSVMVSIGLQPFFALLGEVSGNASYLSIASSLASPNASFIVTTLIIVLGLVVSMFGVRFYVRLQYLLFGASFVSLLMLMVLLLGHSHQDFVNSFNAYMTTLIGPDAYRSVISAAQTQGVSLSPSFNLSDTITVWAIAWLSMGYAFWSVYTAAEIKKATDLTRQLGQILGAYLAVGVLWALTWYAYSNTVGTDFIHAFNGLWFGSNPGPLGKLLAVVPSPFFPFVGSLLTTNPLVFGIILIGAIFGIFQVILIIYFASTRIILASSIDRVLPSALGYVNPRFHAPFAALLVSLVGTEIWLYFVTYQFAAIGSYVATAGFGTEIAYILICVTAILFPFRLKRIYATSQVSEYRIGSLPLISLFGALALLFNLFLTFQYVAGPNLFLTYPLPQSDAFVIGLFVVCLFIFFFAKSVRRRQGIDLSLSFREIPPE